MTCNIQTLQFSSFLVIIRIIIMLGTCLPHPLRALHRKNSRCRRRKKLPQEKKVAAAAAKSSAIVLCALLLCQNIHHKINSQSLERGFPSKIAQILVLIGLKGIA